jgi:ATP-dependent helicase HrpB
VEALGRFRRGGRADAGTDPAALRAAARTAEQLERLVKKGGAPAAGTPVEALGRLLLDAYPDRLARLREPGGERYLLASGRGAKLSPASCVRGRELIVAVEVDAGARARASSTPPPR